MGNKRRMFGWERIYPYPAENAGRSSIPDLECRWKRLYQPAKLLIGYKKRETAGSANFFCKCRRCIAQSSEWRDSRLGRWGKRRYCIGLEDRKSTRLNSSHA